MVSILIPVYNRDKYIAQTIESALNQTYTNIEVIIVDNSSTDNTWKIVQVYAKKDNRIKAFQNDSNIGPVRNWKRCIDEASGKFGKILWSDDLIAPEFIEKTLPFLQKNEEVGFVFTGTELFTDDAAKKPIHFIGKTGIYNSKDYIKGALIGQGYPVSPACAIFRLKDLQNNLMIQVPNKINSDFSMHAIGNDVLIFLFTASQYKYFAFVNEKLSFFRFHKGSISVSSNKVDLESMYHVAKEYFVNHHLDDIKLKKHFNSNLLYLKYIFQKYSNLSSIKDNYYFYSKNNSLNGIHLIYSFLKKLITDIYLFLIKRTILKDSS